MTDETDVLRKALTCMEDAVRMKNMNQELITNQTIPFCQGLCTNDRSSLSVLENEEMSISMCTAKLDVALFASP